MSRYPTYHSGNRFDSALDLSQNNSHRSYEDFEDTQTVTASSVMGPWSQYNTRLESDQSSLTLPTDIHADIGTTICTHCNQEFTGTYRNGNLARHVRQKHVSANQCLYECTAQGCSKVFQRKDARLKHARKRHPELCLPPVQRRQGTEEHPMTPYVNEDSHIAHDLDYNVGQWSQPDHISDGNYLHTAEDGGNSTSGVGHLSHAAQYVFTTLEERLSPTDYSRSCDSFFTRWENIVGHLFEVQSDAYPVYAKVLEDIRAVVHAKNICAHTACSGSDGPSDRAARGNRAPPRGTGYSSLAYESSRIVKRGGRKQSNTSGPSKNIIAAVGEIGNIERRREVDCPVYKHHIMHNSAPPCRGCRVNVMAQVRNHLNPTRTGTHRGFPAFVEQCSRCKQDFVDRELYNDHITVNTCVFQSQTRGDIAIPWARQYLALYPGAVRIPLPWPNEMGWLPDWVSAQCRVLVTNSAVASPFLGGHQGYNNAQPHMPAETTNLTEGPDYIAATDHVLHDLVNPTYIQPPRSETPIVNHDRPTAADLGSPFDGTFNNDSQYWPIILHSFGTHERILREAATYLTQEQLQYMVAESEQIFNISREMYRQYRPQPTQSTQSQTHNTATYEDSSTQGTDATYQTPMQSQHLQTFNYNQSTPENTGNFDVTTPSTDALPSDASYGARSSQRPNSTLTNPSSGYPLSDLGLLSPNSPSGGRRTSLPLHTVQDGSRLHRAYPSRISLPEYTEANIDLVLFSGTDAGYDDLMLYDPERWP